MTRSTTHLENLYMVVRRAYLHARASFEQAVPNPKRRPTDPRNNYSGMPSVYVSRVADEALFDQAVTALGVMETWHTQMHNECTLQGHFSSGLLQRLDLVLPQVETFARLACPDEFADLTEFCRRHRHLVPVHESETPHDHTPAV